jgi:hypothetical protein
MTISAGMKRGFVAIIGRFSQADRSGVEEGAEPRTMLVRLVPER